MQRTIAGVEVVRLVASGGFASVYEARGQEGLRLAVKQLHPDRRAFPRIVQGFQKEAEILLACRIPGVVRAHSYDPEDCAIVMDYLDGIGLDRVLQDCPGEFPTHTRLFIAASICETIHSAHESGLLHLDLKPSNIIITVEGRVMVTDFGAGATIHSEDGENGFVIGAINYMSNEQLNRQPLDPRADVYSLGVLTYELLSGRKPYEIVKSTALRRALDKVRPLDELGIIDLPIEVSLAVQRAMAFDRDARWRSAKEFASLLRRAAPDWPEETVLADAASAVARSWRAVLAAAQSTAGASSRGPDTDQVRVGAPSFGVDGARGKSRLLRPLLAVGAVAVFAVAALAWRASLRRSPLPAARPQTESPANGAPRPGPVTPTALARAVSAERSPRDGGSPPGARAADSQGDFGVHLPQRTTPAAQPTQVGNPASAFMTGIGTLRVTCLPLSAEVTLVSVVRVDGGKAEDVTGRANRLGCPFFIPDLPRGSYRVTVKTGGREQSKTFTVGSFSWALAVGSAE